MAPLVTICITTYNRVRNLDKALRAVQNQTYKRLEILIVDDHSTDNTKQLVSSFQYEDDRIQYIRHTTNKGLSAARNTGIKAAKGEYFIALDDDDLVTFSWIDDFMAEVALNKDYDAFICGHYVNLSTQRKLCRYPVYKGPLKDYMFAGYTPPTGAQFYSTAILKEAGGYNERILSGVDHDLWLTLAFKGIHIKSVSKCNVYVNYNNQQPRITSNMEKRIEEIKASLKVWRADIINNWGEPFYLYFYYAYMNTIYSGFFIKQLKAKNWKQVMLIIKKAPKKTMLVRQVIAEVQKRLITRKCGKVKPHFPAFKKLQ